MKFWHACISDYRLVPCRTALSMPSDCYHRHAPIQMHGSTCIGNNNLWVYSLFLYSKIGISKFSLSACEARSSQLFPLSDINLPPPSANSRQAGSHLQAWLLGNKEKERQLVCERDGSGGTEKNSHAVAKRRGGIWARWLNCFSQIAYPSWTAGHLTYTW